MVVEEITIVAAVRSCWKNPMKIEKGRIEPIAIILLDDFYGA